MLCILLSQINIVKNYIYWIPFLYSLSALVFENSSIFWTPSNNNHLHIIVSFVEFMNFNY